MNEKQDFSEQHGVILKNISKIRILPIKSYKKIKQNNSDAAILITSIADSLKEFDLKQICKLYFFDTEDQNNEFAFSNDHTVSIKNFICCLPKNTELYICCESGESRSPAIAAALLRADGREDSLVWDNPYYHPNILVYRKMCESYGIAITTEEMKEKRQQSEKALHNSINGGQTLGFSRWQIYDLSKEIL